MAYIKAGNISKGSYILFKESPHLVTKTDFISPGKGSAFMRARLKNLKSGNTVEFTFKSTETVEELEINTRQLQFLYTDSDNAVFMDERTFEQIELPLSLVEDSIAYLKAEEEVYVLFHDEKPIGLRPPQKVRLSVTYAEDSTAGNRVNAPKKPVTLETGLIVHAPLFVKVGDVLIIDTQTGEYVSRG